MKRILPEMTRRSFLTVVAIGSGATALGSASWGRLLPDARRVGLVGLGQRGQQILNQLRASQHLNEIVVWDVDRRRLGTVGESCLGSGPSVQRAHSFGDLIKLKLPEIIYIATPDHSHAELSIECMRCGIHVVVDPPLAINEAQLHRLSEVATSTRRLWLIDPISARLENRVPGLDTNCRETPSRVVIVSRTSVSMIPPSPRTSAPPIHIDWNAWLAGESVPYDDQVLKRWWERGNLSLGVFGSYGFGALVFAWRSMKVRAVEEIRVQAANTLRRPGTRRRPNETWCLPDQMHVQVAFENGAELTWRHKTVYEPTERPEELEVELPEAKLKPDRAGPLVEPSRRLTLRQVHDGDLKAAELAIGISNCIRTQYSTGDYL